MMLITCGTCTMKWSHTWGCGEGVWGDRGGGVWGIPQVCVSAPLYALKHDQISQTTRSCITLVWTYFSCCIALQVFFCLFVCFFIRKSLLIILHAALILEKSTTKHHTLLFICNMKSDIFLQIFVRSGRLYYNLHVQLAFFVAFVVFFYTFCILPFSVYGTLLRCPVASSPHCTTRESHHDSHRPPPARQRTSSLNPPMTRGMESPPRSLPRQLEGGPLSQSQLQALEVELKQREAELKQREAELQKRAEDLVCFVLSTHMWKTRCGFL